LEKQFIAYYRVSTTCQGVSGLGLEAQRTAAKSFADQSSTNIIREYTEVESGKKTTRPKLHAAIEECRISGATLLIAKIDRLARNVHFISGLLETNINFVAADMPNADRFMLHIYAAMPSRHKGESVTEAVSSCFCAAATQSGQTV
jgi:DNA invertase Pin-like site-specific DNA recombinase